MNELISIILPAKNAGKFLRQTLESIENQSYSNWECLCVNDHSTDDTERIIKEFSHKNPRFSYLLSQGSGVISALQCGYSHSTGSLISRMDADDLMPEKKLELLQRALLDGISNVATGKVEYFNALGAGFLRYEDWLNERIYNSDHWDHIYTECVVASPNWLIRRSDFDRCGGFSSEVYPEDYDLIFRLYENKLKVTGVNEVTHLWRDHEHRESRNSEHYKNNGFFRLKVDFFSKIELETDSTVVLQGAGKKGKEIAKHLIGKQCRFKWITNNEKKIGKDIYGIKLQKDTPEITANSKVILAMSSPSELTQVIDSLKRKGLKRNLDFYPFV